MPHPLLNLTHSATPETAIAVQQQLRQQVVIEDDFGTVQTVAGVVEDDDHIACAAIAVLQFPNLRIQESVIIRRPTTFPYVPGLLAFREVPVVMEALASLKTLPDLLLCDGNGYMHPRRCGFACHLGILSDLPAIGVAKTPYLGEHALLTDHRGAWQPIYDAGEVLGAVVRTQAKVKPVYVSIGHRISLKSAIAIVLHCAPKYRLPETTRHRPTFQRTYASDHSNLSV